MKSPDAPKIRDAAHEAARKAGLVKMKITRELKTAGKKTVEGMNALGTVTEALEFRCYWTWGMRGSYTTTINISQLILISL